MIDIFRDDYGVPHIVCDSIEEGAKATALCHCEDDFMSIQIWLLAVHGKAGHHDDWDGLYLDFLYSFLGIKEAVAKLKPSISKDYLNSVEQYCQGINEYASSNSNEVLDATIFPISIDDVLEAQHLLEVIGLQLDKPYSFLKGDKRGCHSLPKKEGSNIIAVSGKHTKNGNSMMAISPHQPLEGIFSFYEIHIYYRELNREAFGFLLPITFTIFMGTNFHVAWGFTANYPDMYSIFSVHIKGLHSKDVKVADGKMDLIRKTYINYFALYNRVPIPILIQYFTTPEGKPIIKINGKHYLIDIPLIGYKLGAELNFLLSQSTTVEQIISTVKEFKYPYLDLTAIDSEDNIMFAHNSHEPIRSSAKDYGSDVIKLNSLSQLAMEFEDHVFTINNPTSGYICIANQSPLKTDNQPRQYTGIGLHYYNENSRSTRIKSLLKRAILKGPISLDTLASLFADTKVILPIIRGIDFSILFRLKSKGKIGVLLSVLQKWDGNANIHSEGAAVFALLYHRYKDKYYIHHKNPDRIQIATEAEISKCLAWVSKRYTVGMTLGDIQFIKRGAEMYPIGGIPDSINTVRAYYDNKKLIAEEGCAFRMLIDLKHRDIRTCHPYGSSANPSSKHYTSQLQLFLTNRYKRLKPIEYYQQTFTTHQKIF